MNTKTNNDSLLEEVQDLIKHCLLFSPIRGSYFSNKVLYYSPSQLSSFKKLLKETDEALKNLVQNSLKGKNGKELVSKLKNELRKNWLKALHIKESLTREEEKAFLDELELKLK